MTRGKGKRHMDPDISVIIPHLNQPEPLVRCLASLAAQSLPRERFEVIVVDNGSSERPEAVVAEFDGARLDSEAEPGPGPARNRGVTVARGRILAFIDADCIADPGWLVAADTALSGGEGRRIAGGDVRIALKHPPGMNALEAYESVFAYRQREYIERQGFSGTGNLAVHRSDYEKIGPFGGIGIAEDRDWGRRATAAGYGIVYVPDMIVYHPARENLAELQAKWGRHIAHDLAEWRAAGRGRVAWLLRAAAVAGSPLRDIGNILPSPRLQGTQARLGAFGVLTRIRLYRAWRMVGEVLTWRERTGASMWNRD